MYGNTQLYFCQPHELLSGADGTAVYPEIPSALENLNDAGKWLKKSIVAESQSKVEIADTCIRKAHVASNHASKVLGYIDLEEKSLQPFENPFGPKV